MNGLGENGVPVLWATESRMRLSSHLFGRFVSFWVVLKLSSNAFVPTFLKCIPKCILCVALVNRFPSVLVWVLLVNRLPILFLLLQPEDKDQETWAGSWFCMI